MIVDMAFSVPSLHALLIAELAVRRGYYDVALDALLEQSRQTGDIAVIERAYQLALNTGVQPAAYTAAVLWFEARPDDPEVMRVYMKELERANDFAMALQVAGQLRRSSPQAGFMRLARLAARQPDVDHELLLDKLLDLQAMYEDDDEILMARAILSARLGRFEEAQSYAGLSHARTRRVDTAIEFARILFDAGQTERALDLLRQQRRRHPGALSIAAMYAQKLFSLEDFSTARTSLEALLANWPEHRQSHLLLARIDMRMYRYDAARKRLRMLLADDSLDAVVNYHLGVLERQIGNGSAALEAFQKVTPGPQFLDAQRNATQILVTMEKAETARLRLGDLRSLYPEQSVALYLVEAQSYPQTDPAVYTLFNEALENHPEHPDLLRARARTRLHHGDLAGAEADFSRIIVIDDSRAEVFHELGLMLATHTDRHHEAEALLRRALDLDRENPVYLGNMGWLQYRRGNIVHAIDLLQEAFVSAPGGESAARFGEVLWVSGQRDRALQVWRQGFDKWPDTELLRNTVYRLTGTYDVGI